MKVHFLQHVPYEDPAALEEYFSMQGSTINTTHLYRREACPAPDAFDVLVIMGGPMNIYEERKYPWLKPEKQCIRNAIDAGKKVLGICLGAQLIADVLGTQVYRNDHREIGWFPVTCTSEARKLPAFQDLPPTFHAFHWHGDTFDIPQGAAHLFSSKACKNQGFIYDSHVLALQFHLETTPESARELIRYGHAEIKPDRFVQDETDILKDNSLFVQANKLIFCLLDRFVSSGSNLI